MRLFQQRGVDLLGRLRLRLRLRLRRGRGRGLGLGLGRRHRRRRSLCLIDSTGAEHVEQSHADCGVCARECSSSAAARERTAAYGCKRSKPLPKAHWAGENSEHTHPAWSRVHGATCGGVAGAQMRRHALLSSVSQNVCCLGSQGGPPGVEVGRQPRSVVPPKKVRMAHAAASWNATRAAAEIRVWCSSACSCRALWHRTNSRNCPHLELRLVWLCAVCLSAVRMLAARLLTCPRLARSERCSPAESPLRPSHPACGASQPRARGCARVS